MAAAVFCAAVLSAGTLDKVVLAVVDVATNATADTDTSTKISGYINRVDVTFRTNDSPVYFTVVASNDFTGMTTTIPVDSPLSTNASYQLTNYVQRLSLYNEAITLSATNDTGTNQNVTVTVFYEHLTP
jgi:hypothetical protein